MKKGRRWLGIAGVFLAAFLGFFILGMTVFFPSRSVRAWINSLNIPEKVSVEQVRFDPLMRLRLARVAWRPEANPLVDEVIVPRITVHPSWGRLLLGRKAFEASLELAGARMSGSGEVKKGHLLCAFAAPGGVSFPAPFKLRRGILLHGTWELKGDLDVNLRGGNRGVSGGALFRVKDLRLRWPTSPLGAVDLTFASVTVKGNIASSVLSLTRISLRGNLMDGEGTAVVWPDPVTGVLHAKGTLYFRPKVGLAASNASLDAVVRLLPKEPKGYRLSF